MKRNYLVVVALMLVAAAVPAYALSGRVWSEVADNVAYVHHDDAWFNCCPEMVFEIRQDGYTIDIFEQDTFPQCDCMCYFDFAHTFKGLAPGTYVSSVWESTYPGGDYFLAGRTTFTILALIGPTDVSTQMSDCHMEPGVTEESSPARGLELENVSSSPAQKSVGIRYHLPAQADVTLEIYDVIGTRVRELSVGSQEQGEHLVIWDTREESGQPIPRGIYFVRLKAAGESRSLKLIGWR